jgi:protein O-mannosyl-transferase
MKKQFVNNDKYPCWGIAALLFVVTLLVYSSAAQHTFISYDDPLYVTANIRVRAGLTWENFFWACRALDIGNWHPLTWMSHMLDIELFGLNPSGHHWVSVGIHAANAALLFWILTTLTKSKWPSAFVAAVFALHPLNVESVAWVAERKNVLCTFFAFLSIWAYSHYVRQPGWRRTLPVLIAFALALMSKPMVVTLPFLLLLLDFWPLDRWTVNESSSAGKNTQKQFIKQGSSTKHSLDRQPVWIHLILEKLPLFGIAAIGSLIAIYAQRLSNDLRTVESLSFGVRLANAIVSYMEYLSKTIWPSNLAVFYPHPRNSLPPVLVALSGFCLVGLTTLIIWKARKFKYLAVGWFWYLGTMFPVIGIIQVGDQARADRYAYIPLIGVFIVIVWGIVSISSHYQCNRYLLSGAGLCVLLALGMITDRQLAYWKDSRTLFEHALASTENNYVAHDNLGAALRDIGNLEGAIEQFSKAVDTYPRITGAHRNILANTLLSLAAALQEKGRLEEAKEAIHRAIEINPSSALAYNNLASLLSRLGKNDEALNFYRKALELKPETRLLAEIQFNLGNLFTEQGKRDEAIASFRQTLSWNPEHVQAKVNLGALLYLSGNFDEAISLYQQAIQQKPDASAYYLLGLAMSEHGQIRESVQYFRLALQLNPDHDKAKQRLKLALENLKTNTR